MTREQAEREVDELIALIPGLRRHRLREELIRQVLRSAPVWSVNGPHDPGSSTPWQHVPPSDERAVQTTNEPHSGALCNSLKTKLEN